MTKKCCGLEVDPRGFKFKGWQEYLVFLDCPICGSTRALKTKDKKMQLNKEQQKQLGTFLQDARKIKGLSQLEVAKHFGLKGPQYISNIERGVCPVPLGLLKDLTKKYGVPKSKLLSKMQGLFNATLAEVLK